MSEKENKKKFLNKEISVGKGHLKYPTKTRINLVHDANEKENKKAIKWFVVFMVLLAIFTKVAVLEPMHEIEEAAAIYNLEKQSLDILKENNKDYDEIKAQYDEVTEWYLHEDEVLEPDKLAIFKMIEDDIKDDMGIVSISINGSDIVVNTATTTMVKVSKVLRTLQEDKRNTYVTVTTTSAEGDGNTDAVNATIIIDYGEKLIAEDEGGDN